MPRRLACLDALLVAASACLSYVLLEGGYRFQHYRVMLDEIVAAATAQIPRDGTPSSVFDPFTGYRYRPNIEVGPAAVPFPVHYRTNNHGLIARQDFSLHKPAGEYRLGVIGDSFTANVTSTLRWTDVAEDALNASPRWQAAIGGRRTRVINFGLDGIGTVQFGAVLEHVALPFGLDQLIINMIRNDLIRRPHIRRGEAAVAPQRMADFVRENILGRLNWREIYPEVLAVVAGSRLGLTPHLTLEKLETIFSEGLYYDDGEAATVCAAAIATIIEHFPAALFLLDTTYPEWTGITTPTVPLEAAVFGKIQARFPQIVWTNVITPDRAPKSRRGIDAWFNVPTDQHKNDVGVRAYGEAVAAFLIANRSR
jgi:hypothetical protein